MVKRQGLPIQLICHTKPYNFQNDGAARYFGPYQPFPVVSLVLCLGPGIIGLAGLWFIGNPAL